MTKEIVARESGVFWHFEVLNFNFALKRTKLLSTNILRWQITLKVLKKNVDGFYQLKRKYYHTVVHSFLKYNVVHTKYVNLGI